MTTRFFILLFISLLTISCTTEESITNSEDLQLTMENQENESFSSSRGCSDPCTSDFVYPISIRGYHNFMVTYDPSLTLEEVECLRQKYFTCHTLYMSMIQPTDPYRDAWNSGPGHPDTTVTSGICTDPETGITIECQ